MKNCIPHTIRLQDGSLCNLKKRLWKRAKPLINFFEKITDPRHKRGVRHSHTLILFILFAAITRGSTTLTDCYLWALHNQKFLKRYFSLMHGIPHPTTMSRLLSELDPKELVIAYTQFFHLLGIPAGKIVSFDGKTMRAVTGKDSIRHMLSLFSHITHAVLFQVGVESKENEIPAFRRLLKELTKHTNVQSFLFLADALHAQTETAKAILGKQADYVLVIKGNQKDFFADIQTAFSEQVDLPGTNYHSRQMTIDRFTEDQLGRKRRITTTIRLTHDEALRAYLIQEHGFEGIQTVGLLARKGTRTKKDGTVSDINETVGFVSSRKLNAQEVNRLLRNHWCIENNLHWVKDFVFLEDRQTLRKGNAPQVMSFLRSMAISLCNLSRFRSVADAIHNFDKDKATHYQFLRMAAVV